jgi:acetylornithine deacetylase/succinyl-diaminopimelate desuccinylase-like protein
MGQSVADLFRESRTAAMAELYDLLRIPSISTEPEHAGDVRTCAEWVAGRLRQAGVPEVELIETARHPVVYGAWRAAQGKQTVLVYGHYDVQPVDPLDLWTSDPFAPEQRGDRIYARGVADMKANLLTMIQAVEAVVRLNGAPPFNLVFFLEGEEEIGSPNAAGVLNQHRDRFRADLVLSGDGSQAGPDLGKLTIAVKGMTAMQIDVRTAATDLHSGGYGAAVPNAAQVVAHLAGSFHDSDGRVLVEGFYDDVVDLDEADRVEFAASAISDEALKAEAGVSTLWGESGYTAHERRGGRPTIDINGIWSGFQGAGVKTVTPCLAHLKVTSRLVANQDNAKIAESIQAHARKHAPPGAEISFSDLEEGSKPYLSPRDFVGERAAHQVLLDHYGREPQIARTGGSVPILARFKEFLGIDTVTIGFGLPGSQAHAPNEWYLASQFDRARSIYAAFFEALA